MKMPTLLEQVGVGPKLKTNIALSCPSQCKWGERSCLAKWGIRRTGSSASLCVGKKYWTTDNFSVCWVGSASWLVSDITVITCFLFVLFSTQKADSQQEVWQLSAEQSGTSVSAMQPWVMGCRSQLLLPSERSLSGGRWKEGGRKRFVVKYAGVQPGLGSCYGRCCACSLAATCYWIPSSSPLPQVAVGVHAGGRRSGHPQASGRLRLQESGIKLGIWRRLLRNVPKAMCGKSRESAGAHSAGVCKWDEVPHIILSAKYAWYCFSRVVISSLINLRPMVINSKSSYQFCPVQKNLVQAVSGFGAWSHSVHLPERTPPWPEHLISMMWRVCSDWWNEAGAIVALSGCYLNEWAHPGFRQAPSQVRWVSSSYIICFLWRSYD